VAGTASPLFGGQNDAMPVRNLARLCDWWIAFGRSADGLVRAMDHDGFEDIHDRLRRLEAAVFGDERSRSASAYLQNSDHGALGTPASAD
jgi:hypothetical protein